MPFYLPAYRHRCTSTEQALFGNPNTLGWEAPPDNAPLIPLFHVNIILPSPPSHTPNSTDTATCNTFPKYFSDIWSLQRTLFQTEETYLGWDCWMIISTSAPFVCRTVNTAVQYRHSVICSGGVGKGPFLAGHYLIVTFPVLNPLKPNHLRPPQFQPTLSLRSQFYPAFAFVE